MKPSAFRRLSAPISAPVSAPIAALVAVTALSLGACTPAGTAVGVGAATGVAAAQERSLSDAGGDLWIQAQINELWFRNNIALLENLDMSVNEGRVLLTGEAETQELRIEAVRLTWQVDGVREVINEITVGEELTLGDDARDSLIAAEMRSKLLLDREIDDLNYSIDVVGGTVHILGLAKDAAERRRVVSHAKSIGRVKRVVDHTWLIGDTRRIRPENG